MPTSLSFGLARFAQTLLGVRKADVRDDPKLFTLALMGANTAVAFVVGVISAVVIGAVGNPSSGLGHIWEQIAPPLLLFACAGLALNGFRAAMLRLFEGPSYASQASNPRPKCAQGGIVAALLHPNDFDLILELAIAGIAVLFLRR